MKIHFNFFLPKNVMIFNTLVVFLYTHAVCSGAGLPFRS